VVENFSTGVMERFGLGYEACRALNPNIVYCAISAYGRDGPYADRLGFDPIAQAESGFVAMNGYPDRQGVRASSAVMDISTAMMVGNAVLGALYARTHRGHGQYVEVALFDTALLMTGWATMQHLFTGNDHVRHGNDSVDTCPSGVFQSKDQAFYINCGNDKIFARLAAQVLDRPDLAADPVLADRNGRLAHRESLFATLNDIFATQPWAVLAGPHAGSADPLRRSAHRGAGAAGARGARPWHRHAHPPPGVRRGAEHCLADTLQRHPPGRPRGRTGDRPAQCGGAEVAAGLRRCSHRGAGRFGGLRATGEGDHGVSTPRQAGSPSLASGRRRTTSHGSRPTPSSSWC
jgi:hypothetical protein